MIYTAFCKEPYNEDSTTWINTIATTSIETAIKRAKENCAADRGYEPEDITVIGIVEGTIKLAAWGDNGL